MREAWEIIDAFVVVSSLSAAGTEFTYLEDIENWIHM